MNITATKQPEATLLNLSNKIREEAAEKKHDPIFWLDGVWPKTNVASISQLNLYLIFRCFLLNNWDPSRKLLVGRENADLPSKAELGDVRPHLP